MFDERQLDYPPGIREKLDTLPLAVRLRADELYRGHRPAPSGGEAARVWEACIAEAVNPLETVDAKPDKPKKEKAKRQGSEVNLPEVAPWADPVDGATLLDEIVGALKRFVVMLAAATDTIALWVVHAHAIGAADYSPILTISSPMKECGKTTLQQRLIRRLVPRAVPSVNISGPALFRLIEATGATVLLDEFDSLGPEAKETLRNLLNAGVGRDDAFVYRIIGDKHELRQFAVFGPKSIALNGRLSETLDSRSIVIRLERKKKEEHVERLRRRRADAVLTPLQRKAARWAKDNMERLRECEPEIPSDLSDRACDLWEPLLAVADIAGGDWPKRARDAALALSLCRVEETGIKVELLADICAVWDSRDEDRMPSRDLVAALVEMKDRSWAEWRGRPLTQNGLAYLLKGFEIYPKDYRFPDGTKGKGYERAAFQDAIARYVPRRGLGTGDVSHLSRPENGELPEPRLECLGVSVQTTPLEHGDAWEGPEGRQL